MPLTFAGQIANDNEKYNTSPKTRSDGQFYQLALKDKDKDHPQSIVSVP
jgi:hypothetical protein